MKQLIASKRHGSTATEVIVAATLLLSMIGVVVPTTVRAGRIWRDARHYQIATNELSNQFEYLSSLGAAERALALTQLQVSEQSRQSLEDASLAASLAQEADGVRLTLMLNWDREAPSQPVKIVGWLNSTVTEAPAQIENGSTKEVSNDAT